jgi:hypothetical protein
MTPSPLRLLAVTLLAVCLGLATVLLLPFVFLVWFDAYWRRHEVEAHLSAAMPSPTDAVQCDGGEEDTTPLVDAIRRDMFIEDLEKRLENRVLDEAPLPPAFQRWMDGRQK